MLACVPFAVEVSLTPLISMQAKDLATYKNAFVNLALPFVTLAEPMPAPSAEYGGVKWTLWDRFDVDVGRDFTLKEFIDYFMVSLPSTCCVAHPSKQPLPLGYFWVLAFPRSWQ